MLSYFIWKKFFLIKRLKQLPGYTNTAMIQRHFILQYTCQEVEEKENKQEFGV